MPFYLTRFSYTPATWAKLIKNPEDRRAAAKQYIEAVGGKLHGFWYAFGDHDAYNLWEAPDNVSMAATALAISAGGALSSLQTTVLLTVEETLAALQKASSIKYRPPGERDRSRWHDRRSRNATRLVRASASFPVTLTCRTKPFEVSSNARYRVQTDRCVVTNVVARA